MPDIIKMNENQYQALKKLYELREKSPKTVRDILNKKRIKKEVWVSFYCIYASKEVSINKDANKIKREYLEFIKKYTTYGIGILEEETKDSEIEVDWNALIAQ